MTANKRDACPIDMGKENPVKALHVFAMLGCCGEVEALLDAGVDVDAPDPSGYTALARVAGGKDTYLMEEIESLSEFESVAPEARLWYEETISPMQSRLRNDAKVDRGRLDVIRLLVARGANVEARSREGRTPLALAVYSRNTEAVRLLLSLGASLDTKGDDGLFPLALAAIVRDNVLLDMLLTAGADRSSVSRKGGVFAAYAAIANRPDILQDELAAGRASVSMRDGKGWSLLDYAVAGTSVDAVRLLLQAGADANARDPKGATPLMHVAVFGGHEVFEVVRLLKEAGADMEAKDNAGKNVLDYAVGGCNGENLSPAERPVLLAALATEDVQVSVRMYRLLFAPVLVFAVMNGTLESVRAILEKAKMKAGDEYVRLAFHAAVMQGKTDMVRLFVEKVGKAIFKPRRHTNDVPAVFALLESGNPEPDVLRYLIEAGDDVVHVRLNGKTPLDVAAGKGCAEIARILVSAGAVGGEDTVCRAASSYSPETVLAVCGDDAEVVRNCLEKLYSLDEDEYDDEADDEEWWAEDGWGDDEEEADEESCRSIPDSCPESLGPVERSYADFLRWLMTFRAPTHYERGCALCKCAREGDVESVRLLLDGCDDLWEYAHFQPMLSAAEGGSVEIIRLFAANGLPVDEKSKGYLVSTPLWQAVCSGHTEAVRELLALGANPRRDSFDTSLLELALEKHGYWSREMVAILLDAGAPANPAKLHPLVKELPFPKPFIELFASYGIAVVSRKGKKKRKN